MSNLIQIIDAVRADPALQSRLSGSLTSIANDNSISEQERNAKLQNELIAIAKEQSIESGNHGAELSDADLEGVAGGLKVTADWEGIHISVTKKDINFIAALIGIDPIFKDV